MSWSSVTLVPLTEIALLAISLRASPLLEARLVSVRISTSLELALVVGKLLARRSRSESFKSVILPSPKRRVVIFSACCIASSPWTTFVTSLARRFWP